MVACAVMWQRHATEASKGNWGLAAVMAANVAFGASLSSAYNFRGPVVLLATLAVLWLVSAGMFLMFPVAYRPPKFEVPLTPVTPVVTMLVTLHLICELPSMSWPCKDVLPGVEADADVVCRQLGLEGTGPLCSLVGAEYHRLSGVLYTKWQQGVPQVLSPCLQASSVQCTAACNALDTGVCCSGSSEAVPLHEAEEEVQLVPLHSQSAPPTVPSEKNDVSLDLSGKEVKP